MGDSHFKSNVKAKTGAETITGFAQMRCATLNATTLAAGGDLSVGGDLTTTGAVSAGTQVQIGAHQYILVEALNTEASIVALATAVDASCKGSLFMGTKGNLWFFVSDTAASPVQNLA